MGEYMRALCNGLLHGPCLILMVVSMNIKDYIIAIKDTKEVINKRQELEDLQMQVDIFKPPIADMSDQMKGQMKMAVMTSNSKYGIHEYAPKWERDFNILCDRIENLKDAIQSGTKILYDIEKLVNDLSDRVIVHPDIAIFYQDLKDGRLCISVGEDAIGNPDITLMFKEGAPRFNSRSMKTRMIDVDINDLEVTMVHVMQMIVKGDFNEIRD